MFLPQRQPSRFRLQFHLAKEPFYQSFYIFTIDGHPYGRPLTLREGELLLEWFKSLNDWS